VSAAKGPSHRCVCRLGAAPRHVDGTRIPNPAVQGIQGRRKHPPQHSPTIARVPPRYGTGWSRRSDRNGIGTWLRGRPCERTRWRGRTPRTARRMQPRQRKRCPSAVGRRDSDKPRRRAADRVLQCTVARNNRWLFFDSPASRSSTNTTLSPTAVTMRSRRDLIQPARAPRNLRRYWAVVTLCSTRSRLTAYPDVGKVPL
jgi:hypothetical protein